MTTADDIVASLIVQSRQRIRAVLAGNDRLTFENVVNQCVAIAVASDLRIPARIIEPYGGEIVDKLSAYIIKTWEEP